MLRNKGQGTQAARWPSRVESVGGRGFFGRGSKGTEEVSDVEEYINISQILLFALPLIH